MGAELSQEQVDPNTPPTTLSSRSLEAIAEYIKDGKAERIVVLTGAGISTSAGIPDFRSRKTGLYANLARLNLPYAEAVFDISYFRTNPDPFYILAKELYPGKYYPTVSHAFIALLNEKSLLHQLFTQNIDCLERRAGVPDNKIVEAHGSFATQRCIECFSDFPDDLMKKAVESGDVPHCTVPECNGLVKPDIVFFGEPLPPDFREKTPMVATADLVIVMGTSLSVQPFASLPQFAREDVPRVLFNNEKVGDFGCRLDDVVDLGNCDDSVRKLADALGWREELEELWLRVGGRTKEKEAERVLEERKGMSKDEILEAEIAKITSEVESTLKVSKDHKEWVEDAIERKGEAKGDASKSIKASSREDSSFDSKSIPDVAGTKPEEGGVDSEAKTSSKTEKDAVTAVDRTTDEVPAQDPLNSRTTAAAILDTTLPQHRPNEDPTDSKL